MRAHLILILAITSTLAVGCAKPKTWTPFSSADGKVSVLFPGPPKQQNTTQGALTLTNHTFELRNEAYIFSQTDLPPGAPFDGQAGLNAMVGNFGGTILNQSNITVNGHQGLAYELEIKKPASGYATGRMIKAKDRLYQIMALGTNCRASNPDVQKFLGSLDLSKVK
jgi:hypothetical protein